MSFSALAGSKLLWGCAIAGILIVTAMTVFYLRLCYKGAREKGVSAATLRAVIKSSATFSIVPSIAIVAGLASLAVVVGLPYGWFRLSVLGSVSYELMSANMALSALQLDLANADAYAFGLMAWSMCLGMTLSLFFNLFFNKKIHLGSLKIGAGDKKWGAVAQTTFMSALLVALIVPMLFGGLASLLTFITSALIAVGLSVLAKKRELKWLNDFVLAFSLVGAMAASVLWDRLF